MAREHEPTEPVPGRTLPRRIRRLPEGLINQIAAGEVVERPASAVKELIENAIDAGASCIDVIMRDGGRTLISVEDDGHGMPAEALGLAVERHATSKLPDDDLGHIRTLGFRGEALPSIGSVSRLAIISRATGAMDAWSIAVEGGAVAAPAPAAIRHGTRVEIRDLFFATPARLKFLKTPRTEFNHAVEAIERLAMAHPAISFSLGDGTRTTLRLRVLGDGSSNSGLRRLAAVMGQEFEDNALWLDATREGIRLTGYVGLPTMNKRTSAQQYLFVNGRPVRDRLLYGAVRAACADFVPNDRHAMAALFLDAPDDTVDVNVHPAKTEVRFRDPSLIRGLIVGTVKRAFTGAGHRASSTVSAAALSMLGDSLLGDSTPFPGAGGACSPTGTAQLDLRGQPFSRPAGPPTQDMAAAADAPGFPLGAACAQLHTTYIVAQTRDGVVIVDQHAAHERLVYERMKAALAADGIDRQLLLIPEVVELPEGAAARLCEHAEDLARIGLMLEAFGPGAVIVREIPALLGETDVKGLIRDVAEDIEMMGTTLALEEKLGHICGTMACHGSVRAGRQLNVEEMNVLLRQMENTPHAGQCNHGRPTYVELKLPEIERLFGRR